jgi:hypothetical protein
VSVDVTVETVIHCPVDAVAAYAADPWRAPEWYANIDSTEWLTEPKVVTGAKVAFIARFLGRRLGYTYDFIEVVPGERLVMRTAQGPFPGDHLHVDLDRRRFDAHDAAQPGRTGRLFQARRPVYGPCRQAGEPEGPRQAEVGPRVTKRPLDEGLAFVNKDS